MTVTIGLTVAAILPLLGLLFGIAAIWQSVQLLRLPGYSKAQRRATLVTIPSAAVLCVFWMILLVALANY